MAKQPPSTESTPRGREPKRLRPQLTRAPRLVRDNAIVVLFVALFIALSLSSPTFFTRINVLNILSQQAPLLIMGVAATFVLISGGLDLSIGATFGLAGVVDLTVANASNPFFGVLAALGAGAAVGLANGLLVTIGRVNTLIATIAVAYIVAGLTSMVSHTSVLTTTETSFGRLALSSLLGVRTPVWIALAVAVVATLVLERSAYGRRVFATGGNATAAQLAGVRTRTVLASAFVLSGLAAGLAGALATSQVFTAQAGTGAGLEFTVLTGIVVGGVSILGGQGSTWRACIGILFIALVDNGTTQLAINPLYGPLILGIILIVAVSFDAWVNRRA